MNKPKEQLASWHADIVKLQRLRQAGWFDKGYLVLCFAYEKDSSWEVKLKTEVNKLNGTAL
ncbi:hypothetical protein QPM17_23035 [Marinobacter sp. TBZ242]|uniref:Uncharacterized protein n=1 Tax=Marinobacter azerbaijanicus TaxID=3050455 RepID=A0ABT7IIL2_9GAMM|nr:hypothetical protein [Marinobacter sp. TBZ242]MDL0434020.1 hypothetical protein [Marinobacter sp. TBZ242]